MIGRFAPPQPTSLGDPAKNEKTTVGINLATHLYEFIREIRLRIDQYVAFFDQTVGTTWTPRK